MQLCRIVDASNVPKFKDFFHLFSYWTWDSRFATSTAQEELKPWTVQARTELEAQELLEARDFNIVVEYHGRSLFLTRICCARAFF